MIITFSDSSLDEFKAAKEDISEILTKLKEQQPAAWSLTMMWLWSWLKAKGWR